MWLPATLLWLLAPIPHAAEQCVGRPPPLLLISADGFRWDYLNRIPTPNIRRMAATGARAEQVVNCFTTKTYPNHWSLVTGVYEETHGIVNNNMYDPTTNSSFDMSTCGDWWDAVEPLWATLERVNVSTAAYFWPGSACPWRGVLPRQYRPYDPTVPYPDRVDTVVGWLKRDCASRPAFITLYFDEPDHSGHSYGPYSPQVTAAVQLVDRMIGRLWERLSAADLLNDVNVILTSDHGMVATSPERVIYLDDYVSPTEFTAVNFGAVADILPAAGQLQAVYGKLQGCHPNLAVYLREDLPERWHYKHNLRVMPIVAVADEGWTVLPSRALPVIPGNHGYDNALPSMHPLFVAHGPDFLPNVSVPSISILDVYPLMCRLLAAPCHAHNGSLAATNPLVRAPASAKGWVALLISLMLFILLMGLAGCVLYGRTRRRSHGATQLEDPAIGP